MPTRSSAGRPHQPHRWRRRASLVSARGGGGGGGGVCARCDRRRIRCSPAGGVALEAELDRCRMRRQQPIHVRVQVVPPLVVEAIALEECEEHAAVVGCEPPVETRLDSATSR